MNSDSGDDPIDFERHLRGMELRRPPAEWKALLLPRPVPPLFPKPLLFGLAACWIASAGFWFSMPPEEDFGPSIFPPAKGPSAWRNTLAYQTDVKP